MAWAEPAVSPQRRPHRADAGQIDQLAGQRVSRVINYLVVDRRVLPCVDRPSFRQVTHRQKAVWDKPSDHCPVLVELWVR
jgi:hypothetical protein